MVATTYPLLDIFLTMLIIAGLFLWVVLLVMVFADLFKSDASGGTKALWTIVVIIVPLFGAIAYLIVHGKGMNRRAAERQTPAEQELIERTAPVGRVQNVDDLTELIKMRDAGTITAEEYEQRKAEFFARSRPG